MGRKIKHSDASPERPQPGPPGVCRSFPWCRAATLPGERFCATHLQQLETVRLALRYVRRDGDGELRAAATLQAAAPVFNPGLKAPRRAAAASPRPKRAEPTPKTADRLHDAILAALDGQPPMRSRPLAQACGVDVYNGSFKAVQAKMVNFGEIVKTGASGLACTNELSA